jgi:hypothetical protein
VPGSSKYPKALDGLPVDSASSTNAREGKPTGGPEGFHSGLHNDTSAAVNALQGTLGINPQGGRTSVAERLGVMEGEIEAGLGELPENIASTEDVAASKVFIDARDWVGHAPSAADKGPALNEAFKAAAEEGPGAALILPPWQLVVSEPAILDSFVELIGQFGSSWLKVGAGSNCGALQSARYGVGGTTGGTEKAAIRGVSFDGNFAENGGATHAVVELDGLRPFVKDVHIRNGYRNLSSKMSRELSAGGSKLEDGVFSDIGLLDSQVTNFLLEGPHDTQILNVLARTNDGVNIASKGVAPVWTNCHAYGNCEYPWEVTGGLFHGCIGEGGEKAQAIILADSTKWWDCWFFYGGGTDGKVGVQFGDATHTAFTTLMENVRIDGCTNGPLKFVGGHSNSKISGQISGASGNIGVAEPSISNKIHVGNLKVTGGCVDNLNVRSVASTKNLEIPFAGFVEVTGATEITKIAATFPGHRVTLLFTSTAKLKQGETLAAIKGSYEGGAGRTITLLCDGTNWQEVARNEGASVTKGELLAARASVLRSRDPWRPEGTKAESISRLLADKNSGALLTSGTLFLAGGLILPEEAITAIHFYSATTAAVEPTHQWAVICDLTRKILAISKDKTTEAWGANAKKTFELEAALAAFTEPTPVYIGLLVTATTPPSLQCHFPENVFPGNQAPILAGNSNTGLTVPGGLTVGGTATAITAKAQVPYVTVA